MAIAGEFIACLAIKSVANELFDAAEPAFVCITELQRPGGKRLKVADFVRGFELKLGMCFEPVSANAP